MKKILLIFLSVLTLFAAQATAPKSVTLQLKWNHQFQFAGYYAAKEKGFYKDVGLDVRFRQIKETKDSYGDVLHGKAEFGIYTSELLLRYHRGDPVVALGAIFQHSPFALMTLQNSNLSSMQSLRDKKIMLEHGSAELEAYFKREGIKLNQKNIIEHTNTPKALLDKSVDAMSVYVTDEPYYLGKQKAKYRLFYPKSVGIDFYGDILFTTQSFAKNNPELVENFKKASMKGWEYALSHPDEISEIILRHYNTENKTKEQLLFEASQMQKLIKSDTVELGYLYPWRLTQILGVYEELGMAQHDGKQPLNDFILENYLQKIRSEHLTLTDKEKAYLAEKGEIKVCVDPDWLPLERLTNSGTHEGIAADMLKILSERLKIKISVVPTKNWEESLQKAKNRECDMLSMAMETQQRQNFFTFTKPYFSSPLALVTKDDKQFIGNSSDAFEQPLAIVKEYAIVDILKKKYPNAHFVEVKNRNEGLKKVADGFVYGYIDALSAISYALGKEGWNGLKVSARFDERFELGAAVRNDDQPLVSIVEKGLQSITQTEKDAILNKWFSVVVEEGVSYETVLKGLVAILIVVFLLYYKNVILEKRVNEETKKRLAGEQLITERSKMAQIGELLDMMAHQWKQPLTAISLTMSEIAMANEYNELTNELLLSSKKSVNDRISFLVKMLDDTRGFLNPNQKESLFNVGEATKDMLGILQCVFKELNIEINAKIDTDIWLEGSKNSFQNIILSIISNSKDVFQQNHTDSPKIDIELAKENGKAILAITDNGGGIDTANLDKIFDYRFTTKANSGGTGVGLHLVKLIVTEKLGGKIEAYNTNNGVCFKMVFSGLH